MTSAGFNTEEEDELKNADSFQKWERQAVVFRLLRKNAILTNAVILASKTSVGF